MIFARRRKPHANAVYGGRSAVVEEVVRTFADVVRVLHDGPRRRIRRIDERLMLHAVLRRTVVLPEHVLRQTTVVAAAPVATPALGTNPRIRGAGRLDGIGSPPGG